MAEAKENVLAPELINKLSALQAEGNRKLLIQLEKTRFIQDVFEGREPLTPEALVKVNNSLMLARQMSENVRRVMFAIQENLPKDNLGENVISRFDNAQHLIVETHRDINQAVKAAKIISGWASIKIDGTDYSDEQRTIFGVRKAN